MEHNILLVSCSKAERCWWIVFMMPLQDDFKQFFLSYQCGNDAIWWIEETYFLVPACNQKAWMAVRFLSCLGLGRPSVLLAVLQEWRCAVTLGRQVGNPVNELVEGGVLIVEQWDFWEITITACQWVLAETLAHFLGAFRNWFEFCRFCFEFQAPLGSFYDSHHHCVGPPRHLDSPPTHLPLAMNSLPGGDPSGA